jgi:hypothetical protein
MSTPMKSVVAFVGSFVPVIYCGYLVYYFVDLSDWSVQQLEDNQLGPTVLGLTIVGLLFCIPVFIKIALIIAELRKPRLGGGAGGSSPGGGDTFDADAVVARYLAQKQAEAPAGMPASSGFEDGTARRSSFGRRTK